MRLKKTKPNKIQYANNSKQQSVNWSIDHTDCLFFHSSYSSFKRGREVVNAQEQAANQIVNKTNRTRALHTLLSTLLK